MSEKTSLKRYAIVAVACGISAALTSSVSATTWNGTTSAWGTSSNWTPSGAPANSVIAEFDSTFSQQPEWTTSSLTGFGGIWLKTAPTGTSPKNVLISGSGTGAMQFNGTTIDGNASTGLLVNNADSATLTISLDRIKIGNNSQSWINNSSNVVTINSKVDLDNKTLTITGSGNTTIGGNVVVTSGSNVGTLLKTGAGTLTLAGSANDYRGNATLSAGTMLVNGTISNSSTYTVTADGGVLGGTGSIGRKTTIGSLATLAPGASDTVAEDLTFTRTLTLNGTTTFDLTSAGYDKLLINAISGQLESERKLILGGTLKVEDRGVAFANGQVFDLFDWNVNTVVEGDFSTIQLPSLPSGLTWRVFEDGDRFDNATGTIEVVPEPASLSVLGLASLLLRRRRSL